MNASSQTSVNFAPKHLSGIDVIDDAWGGLYRGGSYLVYGRAASGRGLLTLMFARTGAAFSEPTLLVSPDRQKDLMIQAASIGFNLREAHESGIVRLLRVPPLMNLQNMGDDGVSKALWDLVTLIRRHRPTRLIMNDFMPFVAFRSFDRFRNEFIQFLEQIDSLDTTTLLVMPEPANPQSNRVIEFMASQMTGSIHIELAEDSPNTTKRRISLIPHIGHIKRQVVDYWDLEDLIQTTKAPERPPVAPVPKPDELIFKPSPEQSPFSHSKLAGMGAGSNAPQVISGPAYPSAPQQNQPSNPNYSPQVPEQAPPQPAAPFSGQPSYAGNPPPATSPYGGPAQGGPAQGGDPSQSQSVSDHRIDPNRPVPPFFGGATREPVTQSGQGYDEHQSIMPNPAPPPATSLGQPMAGPDPNAAAPDNAGYGSPSSPSGMQGQGPVTPQSGMPGQRSFAPPFGTQSQGASATPSQGSFPTQDQTPFSPPPVQPVTPSQDEIRRARDSFAESESVFAKQQPSGQERTPSLPPQTPPSISFPPAQPPAPIVPKAPVTPLTPMTPPSAVNVESEYTNREAFRERLQQQFSNRDVLHQPFLLLALRMDRSAQSTARPFDFDFLLDLVGEELRVQDDMLANIDLERLVVYLADSRPEEAQSFFTRLKDRLRQESPTQADHLLHSVSAIVVPDGRPFQNAGEFLNYALDEA